MITNDVVKKIIDEKHLSFGKAGELCGLNKTTMKRIYDGQATQFTVATIQKLSNGLGVSVEALLGWENNTLDKDEAYLINLYRTLSPKLQGKIELFAEQLSHEYA